VVSRPPGIANLNSLSTPFIIAAQHWPAGSIGLRQRQFQFSAQYFELGLLGVNWCKQLVCVFVALVIGGREIQIDRFSRELNLRLVLIDLLEIQRDIDRVWRLVEVIPK
jgi:hypothetical protein